MRRPFPRFVLRLWIPLIVLAAAFSGGCSKSGEPFPVRAYLSAPENLQGNRYQLEAEVDSQLGWREGVGRLIVVRTLREDARVGVYIADALKANLLVAQRYRMEITVRKGGLLYIDSLEKL